MVVIVFGLPGSGKSYFACRLAGTINAVYISSDMVRRKMFAARTYSPEEKLAVYDEMLAQTLQYVSLNKSVVLDATFYLKNIRQKFINQLKGCKELFFIEVTAPDHLISERVRQKRAESEAGPDVYKKIKVQWEPMNEEHLVLKSLNDNVGNMLQIAAGYLDEKNDNRTNK